MFTSLVTAAVNCHMESRMDEWTTPEHNASAGHSFLAEP